MPSKTISVIDADGVEREVYPCDAREIVEAGGRYADEAEAVPESKRPEKPKEDKKKKK